MSQAKRRLLLVDWDAADWKVINPLLDKGEMPNLARLVAGGVIGNIATLHPAYSPMLWTSIATGKRPTKHGIHGFTDIAPNGSGVRPVSSLSRKVKAVWNILNQNNLKPSVVGWWPSHPAEPVNGVMVSDFFSRAGDGLEPLPLIPGTIHPPEWVDRLEALRIVPMELPAEALRMFVPQLDRIDQDKDKRLLALGKLIAEVMTVHGAGTEVLEHADWDFAAVYYDSIDHFSHAFMRYRAPRLPWVSEQDFEIYSPVIDNAYRYHDAMLGRLLQLAGPETTVLLLSDHGFHADQHRLVRVPAEAAGPALEHRHFGIFCLSGPGIRKDDRVYGASLLDIAPTVLHLFGLPVGRDMDGKVLTTALEPGAPLVEYVDSWEAIPGDAGTHPGDIRLDGAAAAESMKQLVALGYVAPPPDDVATQIAETLTELKYNLARCHDDAAHPELAIPLYRELLAENPAEHRAVECLFGDLLSAGQTAEAAEMLARFDEAAPRVAEQAAAALAERRARKADEDLDSLRSGADLRDTHERQKLIEQSGGYVLMRTLLHFRLELTRRDLESSDRWFQKLQEICLEGSVRMPALVVAESFAMAGKTDEALEWAAEALEDNPESFSALALAARLHLERHEWHPALVNAARSLGLVYFQPYLHYIVGTAHRHLGDWERAEQALQVALVQAPGFIAARTALADLYLAAGRLGDAGLQRSIAGKTRNLSDPPPLQRTAAPPSRVRFHDRLLETRRDAAREIVVVTGLPRSGTSMLMQAVTAGGVPPLTDNLRAPDEDNPRGYFEFEPATRLRTDRSWIPRARGKVVKLVLPLLPYLPPGELYRIVLIQRDLSEVAASQHTMLERLQRSGQAAALSETELQRAYLGHEEEVARWLESRQEIAVLSLDYDRLLGDPRSGAARLAVFLGSSFDSDPAAAAIVPQLRRQFAIPRVERER